MGSIAVGLILMVIGAVIFVSGITPRLAPDIALQLLEWIRATLRTTTTVASVIQCALGVAVFVTGMKIFDSDN